MLTLQRLATSITKSCSISRISLTISKTQLNSLSTKSKIGEEEWNDAWESAWLPEDLTAKTRAPWETDVNFPTNEPAAASIVSSEVDPETKAFVEDMNEHWDERKGTTKKREVKEEDKREKVEKLYSLENIKKDYRLKKQRVHAALWLKEIDKQEEAKLGDSGGGDDIERLLDSCSEIFDSTNRDFDNSKVPSSSEFKNKPDGWETTAKEKDGNVWDMSQREEDILLQEFDRRIAYCKFQVASFIKQHIFSRRRPIDGWKYMIEELGPNARKGKGSVARVPALSDAATQPFKEDKTTANADLTSYNRRR